MGATAAPSGRFVKPGTRPLPEWCDRYLAPDSSGDIFASRAWYDTVLTNALPSGAEPVLAECGDAALLPLVRQSGRMASMTTPYTLAWRPLFPDDAPTGALAAGRAFGAMIRHGPPVRLDALDPEAPGLARFLDGVAAAGLYVLRYAHFANWHEYLAEGASWAEYLQTRPSALRNTVARKLARSRASLETEELSTPGEALERGIAAYEAVRAQSWKPHEPFPDFDRALIRALAQRGVIRLGVLRQAGNGAPLAAQYWVVGGGRATVLKLAHVDAARDASPGTVLTATMIRRLIESEGIRELDFGRGDDAYKQLWVRQRRERIGVVLADPRHPGGLLAVMSHAAGHGRRRITAWLGSGRRGAPSP